MNTRYDGKGNEEPIFLEMVKAGNAVPFCPEQAGGLPTPRDPSEIIGGDGKDVLRGKARVTSSNGQDVTEEFLKGAKETLKLAKLLGVSKAILKSKSPSCGCKHVYDGTFKGITRKGIGVTAAYLRENNFDIIDSEEFLQQASGKSQNSEPRYNQNT